MMDITSVICEGFPILIPSFHEDDWSLYEEFSFWVNGNEYIIPEGFRTDLASSKGLARLFVPRWGKYGVGTIIHDYCYREHIFDRKTSDKIFKIVMGLYNTEPWRKHLIYISVRLFGWFPYNKNRK
jgi:hypothetical protein